MKKQSAIAALSVGAVLLLATVAAAGPFGHGNGPNVAEGYGRHMSSFQQVAEASGQRAAKADGKTSVSQPCGRTWMGSDAALQSGSFDQRVNNNWR